MPRLELIKVGILDIFRYFKIMYLQINFMKRAKNLNIKKPENIL